MALTGQNIVDRAWIKAKDNGATKRWGSSEALMWVNDARREIVNIAPRAYTQRTIVTAGAGTRQTLAGLGLTNGIQFVDVPRNFSTDGITPGPAITKIPRAWLDERRRSWQMESAADAVHWTADDEDPTAIYIYPAKTSGKLEVVFSALPDELTALSQSIGLSDIYANAVQWFVLFSFFSKDAEHQKSSNLALFYSELFGRAMGMRWQVSKGTNQAADAKAAGGTP